jgi:hypothetical protein
MASRPTQRGRKPQNKRDVQPEPQNAAKGRSLPNIAQGRPVAIAAEQFMQAEDRQKIEEILEWFENEKAQYALKQAWDEYKEEISLKSEQIQNLVDRLNLFDVSNMIYFDGDTQYEKYFRINSTEYVLFDQKITINSFANADLDRFCEIVGETFLIEAERQKLIGDHKTLVKTFADLRSAELWPTVSFNLRKFRHGGLLEKLRAGELIGCGFLAGQLALAKIETGEWQGEWEFDESADSARRESSPKLEIKQLRIFTSAEVAATKPHNERGGGAIAHGDWPQLMHEFIKRLLKDGYPKSAAEAYRWVQEAARNSDLHEFDDNSIKDHFIRTFGKDFFDSLKR